MAMAAVSAILLSSSYVRLSKRCNNFEAFVVELNSEGEYDR